MVWLVIGDRSKVDSQLENATGIAVAPTEKSHRAARCVVLAVAALEPKKPGETNKAKPTPLATIVSVGHVSRALL